MRTAAGLYSIWSIYHFQLTLHYLGASPADSQIAGREHHIVPYYQPTSILYGHYAENHWRRTGIVQDLERVRRIFSVGDCSVDYELELPKCLTKFLLKH